MTIRQIANAFPLRVLCAERNLDREIQGGYASDMLSCVLAGAQPGSIWVTLMTHLNVIAVAALKDLPAVIITENAPIDAEALEKAEQQGIVMLHTADDTYTTVGQLHGLGVH